MAIGLLEKFIPKFYRVNMTAVPEDKDPASMDPETHRTADKYAKKPMECSRMYRNFRTSLKLISHYWRTFVLVLTPLLSLPIPLMIPTKAARCGWVIIIMAFYWMCEVVPLPVTGLMPVFMFPMLGIMDTGQITQTYMKETVMMFIGGLIMALAIEHCNLHKRLALKVLIIMGISRRWIILAFMLNTMILSMCISNTATVALMLPITDAVIGNMKENHQESGDKEEDENTCRYELQENGHVVDEDKPATDRTEKEYPVSVAPKSQASDDPDYKDFRTILFLGIGFGANIGGTGSLAGTGPNLVFKGMLEKFYGGKTPLNFASWMVLNIPGVIIGTLVAWVVLQLLFTNSCMKKQEEVNKSVRKNFIDNYNSLGPMTMHEILVIILFLLLIFLWFFREPHFIPGWASLFPNVYINDATPTILIVFLMFVFPASPKMPWQQWKDVHRGGRKAVSVSPTLHEWTVIHQKLPWGTCILIGGGFAVAEAANASGLSAWVADQMSSFQHLPTNAIVILTSCITSCISEVASNTATATITLPMLAKMAEGLHINPLHILVPATVACSYSFVFPVSHPSNMLIYEAGNLRMIDMMKPGIIMKFFCIFLTIGIINTIGYPLLQLGVYPDWATQPNQTYLNLTSMANESLSTLIQ